MAEDTEEKTQGGAVTLPMNALVKEVPGKNYALFDMPKTGSYAGYRFLADLDKIKADFALGLVTVPLKEFVKLRRGDGAEETLTRSDTEAALFGISYEDFKGENFSVTLPKAAVYARFKNVTRLLLPPKSDYKGAFCTISNSCLVDAGEGKGVKLTLSDWMYVTVRTRGGEKVRISGKDFAKILEEGKQSYSERTKWVTVTVPREAVADRYERQSRLRMPKGEYGGFSAYLPSGMIKETKNPDEYLIMMPKTRPVRLKNAEGERKSLTPEEYKKLVEGAAAEKYLSADREERDKFMKKAEDLKVKLPDELTSSPGWVDVRVKRDVKGRTYESSSAYAMFLAKKVAGPEGAPFEEAAAYGSQRRADTLGFAFSGDGVVCVTLRDCLDAEGKITDPAAEKILAAALGTYAERSASGSDVHIFCLLDAEGLGHLSKDGKFELFSSSDYVAVTGDAVTESKKLEIFGDGSAMKKLLTESFPEDKPISAPTKDDKRKIDAAMKAEGSGETFRSLYEGKNEKGTAEYCDENLMTRIACRTLGDTEAMKRIYFSSGRANKSAEHIAHLAARAKRQTASFVERAKKDMNKNLASAKGREHEKPSQSAK